MIYRAGSAKTRAQYGQSAVMAEFAREVVVLMRAISVAGNIMIVII